MSKPLVLPTQDGEPWELAPSQDGHSSADGPPLEKETGCEVANPPDRETVTADLPKEPSRAESSDGGASHTRPDDPVPMSVDSVDPVAIPTPDSDESWTELYERTCGDPTPTAGDRGREKRPRSPDFIPEKRLKQDALRTAFVRNRETIKANSAFPLASLTGSSGIDGMEAAFTAWVAQICDRPSGQEP